MGIVYDPNLFRDLLEYSEESPSELIWSKPIGQKIKAGNVAGSLTLFNGKPKCWDVRLDGVLYKAHRIIMCLIQNTVLHSWQHINHIDNNPSNNKIENLELVTHTANMRKASCHTGKKLRSKNTTGVTGVSAQYVKGELKYYVAFYRDAEGKVRVKVFSVKKRGLNAAFNLAVLWREEAINKRNIEGANYAVCN